MGNHTQTSAGFVTWTPPETVRLKVWGPGPVQRRELRMAYDEAHCKALSESIRASIRRMDELGPPEPRRPWWSLRRG